MTVKTFIAVFFGNIAFAVSIPLVFANGGDTTPQPDACGQIGVILHTIRTLESGGNYEIHSSTSTASGAYQYINTTWRHWAEHADISTDQYPTAASAPAHIQDHVAGVNVTSILAAHDNHIEAIPIIWYLPAAWDNDTIMDRIPSFAGNTLTPREYQTKWMAIFNDTAAANEHPHPTLCADTDTTGQWALPAPRDTIGEHTLNDAHHTYPAWDLIIPTGTPIYAVTSGTVANISTWGGNWWNARCNGTNPPSGCSTCGIGITIQHDDGLRHTYCHLSAIHVAKDNHVTPGQHIGNSGDTGRSGTPHLHLEFRINNTRRCPQPLLHAIYHDNPIPDPHALPTTGCFF